MYREQRTVENMSTLFQCLLVCQKELNETRFEFFVSCYVKPKLAGLPHKVIPTDISSTKCFRKIFFGFRL